MSGEEVQNVLRKHKGSWLSAVEINKCLPKLSRGSIDHALKSLRKGNIVHYRTRVDHAKPGPDFYEYSFKLEEADVYLQTFNCRVERVIALLMRTCACTKQEALDILDEVNNRIKKDGQK